VARQPRVMFSSDGSTWSVPQRILAEGDWLWRVTWHDGRAFDEVTTFAVPRPAERDDAAVHARRGDVGLVRREAGNRFAWIGRSRAPYTTWTWRETQQPIGGPNFIRLSDGELWASGRSSSDGPKTAVGRLSLDGRYEPAPTLPSGGDTLSRDGVARRSALVELVRLARGQDRDRPGACESPLTCDARVRRYYFGAVGSRLGAAPFAATRVRAR
jgi:hypothetical protein